jgi:phage gp45-like
MVLTGQNRSSGMVLTGQNRSSVMVLMGQNRSSGMVLTGQNRSSGMVLTGQNRSSGMVLTGQNSSIRRKTRITPALSTTNPKQPDWGSNPEANYLSYGTTQQLHIIC